MCQAISTDVAAAMSDFTQATPPPPGRGGNGRGGRIGRGGNPKKDVVPGNCNRCGKAGQYVRECTKRNTYWDPTTAGTKDTDTKVHHKQWAK